MVCHFGSNVRLISQDSLDFKALAGVQDGGYGAVRHLQGLDDAAGGAEGEEVVLLRLFHHHIKLRHGSDEETFLFGIVYKLHGFLPANGDREDGARKQHYVAESQNRQNLREFRFVILHHRVPLYYRNDAHFSTCRKSEFFILSHMVF